MNGADSWDLLHLLRCVEISQCTSQVSLFAQNQLVTLITKFSVNFAIPKASYSTNRWSIEDASTVNYTTPIPYIGFEFCEGNNHKHVDLQSQAIYVEKNTFKKKSTYSRRWCK